MVASATLSAMPAPHPDDAAARFSKTAPPGLAISPALRAAVASLPAGYVLDHGFSRDQIGPEWWAAPARLIEIRFPAGDGRLTRAVLFERADTLNSRSDAELLDFLWHVLAWGSGTSRRMNDVRIASAREPAAIALLRKAFDSARTGKPREAYATLIRTGGGKIAGLGPAFFTKFLYFAAGATPDGVRPLILDARVARGLDAAGWKLAPGATDRFSYNWYTDTYADYCDLLARWAKETGVRADVIERALFEGRWQAG